MVYLGYVNKHLLAGFCHFQQQINDHKFDNRDVERKNSNNDIPRTPFRSKGSRGMNSFNVFTPFMVLGTGSRE